MMTNFDAMMLALITGLCPVLTALINMVGSVLIRLINARYHWSDSAPPAVKFNGLRDVPPAGQDH
jgi:hypothetical protein